MQPHGVPVALKHCLALKDTVVLRGVGWRGMRHVNLENMRLREKAPRPAHQSRERDLGQLRRLVWIEPLVGDPQAAIALRQIESLSFAFDLERKTVETLQ